MHLTTTFIPLLQVFAAEMTQPTYRNFITLVGGWLLAPRRTILGMVRASNTDQHHAAFHRIFSAARWSLDQVGLAVFDLISSSGEACLVGDDTLLPRSGLKVFGTGMHRDPLLSSRGHTVTRWGNCWVVLCVLVESRHFPGRWFSLPVLFRLYLNKKSAKKWKRVYRKKSDLMLELLKKLERHTTNNTDQTLHFIGDSAYTAPAVLALIPASIEVTGRVVANVRMSQPPAPSLPNQVGRPRKRGEALPKPEELLEAKGLRRIRRELYKGREYTMRIAEQIGQFYKAPGRDVKVVVAEHLKGGRGVEVFYTTQVDDEAETVMKNYSLRWTVEVTNHDTKQHLGVEEPQNRTTQAVRRTAPTGFLLYSLVVWWHETVREEPAPSLRDWSGKAHPSFADMLAALRGETLSSMCETDFSTPSSPPRVQKIIQYITHLLSLAA